MSDVSASRRPAPPAPERREPLSEVVVAEVEAATVAPDPTPSAWPAPADRPTVARARRARFYYGSAAFVDAAMLLLAASVAVATDDDHSIWLPTIAVSVGVTLYILSTRRAYAPRMKLEVLEDVRLAVAASAIGAMAGLAFDTFFRSGEPSAYDSLRLWVLTALILSCGRIALTQSVLRSRTRGGLGSPTLVVGAGLVGVLTARRLIDHPELGLQPIGFLDKEPLETRYAEPVPIPVLGASWDLEEVVRSRQVECVVIAFSNAPHDEMLWLLDECGRLGLRTLVVPRLFERVPSRLEITHVGGLPLLETLPTSPKSVQYAIKYALDRLVALLLIAALAPLLASVAVAVRLSLGAPILYRQERVGLDGRRFAMLKFRTMHAASDGEHLLDFTPAQAPGGVEGTDRRTRLGRFLRRTSLDELAQLFNVAKGEMSLVGPRPERPEYVQYFTENVRRYDARHRVKSGITGWAQIHRLRGKTSISDRVEWDNYYIENFSLWLDLKILVRTIPEVLRGGVE